MKVNKIFDVNLNDIDIKMYYDENEKMNGEIIVSDIKQSNNEIHIMCYIHTYEKDLYEVDLDINYDIEYKIMLELLVSLEDFIDSIEIGNIRIDNYLLHDIKIMNIKPETNESNPDISSLKEAAINEIRYYYNPNEIYGPNPMIYLDVDVDKNFGIQTESRNLKEDKSFKDYVCEIYGTDDIDLNDLTDEDYEELESDYNDYISHISDSEE